MPEVTRFESPLLPEGVSMWSTSVEIAPRSGSRREAEREAVGRLIARCFGPDVSLSHAANGVPLLFPPSPGTEISISHSPTEAWLAVSTSGIIGIDAEAPRPQLQRVAARFLAPAELATEPSLERLLDYWTAKESIYKAALTPGLDPRDILVDLDTSSGCLADGRTFSLYFLRQGLTLAMPK